jgi:large subunit ribosomal protein L9
VPTMRVILLNSIRGIGQAGDIKDVSDGYARNFLFPRGSAKPATDGMIKEAASIRVKNMETTSLAHQQAADLALKLNGSRIELSGKANSQGKLFAGIEAGPIAASFSTLAGVHITADAVKLAEHIKTVGEHTVSIELADGVTTLVTVVVSAL